MSQRWEVTPFYGVLVLSLVGLLLPSEELPTQVDIGDKVMHALIFVTLAVTGRFGGFGSRALAAGLLGYAVLTEVLQGALPIGRDGDWHDVVADAIGIAVGLGLSWLLGRTTRGRR